MNTNPTLLAVALLTGAVCTSRGQSIIQFSANFYTVAESAGAVTLMVQRAGDSNTAVTVDYATADGTATNGLKYTTVSGTLTFGTSETNKTIVVPILNEGFVEGTKTFSVALSNPTSGAVLGAKMTATVSITDNDLGTQFQFASYSVAEDAGALLLGIVRDDDGALPITVDFLTTDLTAKSELDYTGITNTLSFSATERLKFVSIPILNNSIKQPNRNFRVTLANPVGATLGSTKTTTVTIVDNDQGFQFEFASYSVAEDAGVVRIDVLRGTDDTNFPITVELATSDLTATNGLDYSSITNTLAFAPGERVRQVTVPIYNNGIKQATRSFRLTLTNPTGGGALGSPTITTVSILDNDPGVSFGQTSYTNAWENPGVSVMVLRGNDWDLGPVTVDYATSDLTAKGGQDYQAVSGTIAFGENETVKTLTIPLLRNRAAEGTKAFHVTLSNATGGAMLGASVTTVSIVGAYFTLAPPFDTALTIRHDLGFDTLTWAGGGLLQRADNPTGPWQTLAAAKSPSTIQPLLPATCYRVALPRPVDVYLPSSYDRQTPMPLVIFLHGYGRPGNGPDTVEGGSQIRLQAEARGFLYCYPSAPVDRDGSGFWNATDACCDFYHSGRDDAGYLRAVIEEIGRSLAVDRKRIYLIGWSNGAFMAHRMACHSPDLIAGIVSRAGGTFLDPSLCAPSQPVNILHVHGSKDMVNFYDGGADTTLLGLPSNMSQAPGARQTVAFWAGFNGASDPVTESSPSMDLDLDVPGLDTVITRYMNYPPGGAVELWTINGATHFPTLSPEFAPRVIDWLLAHPKP